MVCQGNGSVGTLLSECDVATSREELWSVKIDRLRLVVDSNSAVVHNPPVPRPLPPSHLNTAFECVKQIDSPASIEPALLPSSEQSPRNLHQLNEANQRGKGDGMKGGGSQGELGEGPGVVDLQRCWGFSEQSYTGRI